MSIGPMSGLPPTAAQDNTAHQRQVQTDAKAEAAAGIGQTSEDQQAGDRDADGRRLWEPNEEDPAEEASDEKKGEPQAKESTKPVKDVHGNCGNSLDLTG